MLPRRIPLLAAITPLYFIAGRIGLSMAFVNVTASAIWPPTGLAIPACLLLGTSVWPAVAGRLTVGLTPVRGGHG